MENYNEIEIKELKKNPLVLFKKALEKYANAKKPFTCKPFNDAVVNGIMAGPALPLYGELWRKSEICIFFADAGIGKTLLSVQIGQMIASGKGINGFRYGGEINTPAMEVAYFDFEMSEVGLGMRYNDDEGYAYKFHENLTRHCFNNYYNEKKIDENKENTNKVERNAFVNKLDIFCSINKIIKILIIDNISAIAIAKEKSDEALNMMKSLQQLRDKYTLSILIVAHIPKTLANIPISPNHLAGSKYIFNLIDSCFSMGRNVNNKNQRYLKQLKNRNGNITHGEDNVLLMECTIENSFLGFKTLGTTTEYQCYSKLEKGEEIIMNEIVETKISIKEIDKTQEIIKRSNLKSMEETQMFFINKLKQGTYKSPHYSALEFAGDDKQLIELYRKRFQRLMYDIIK